MVYCALYLMQCNAEKSSSIVKCDKGKYILVIEAWCLLQCSVLLVRGGDSVASNLMCNVTNSVEQVPVQHVT